LGYLGRGVAEMGESVDRAKTTVMDIPSYPESGHGDISGPHADTENYSITAREIRSYSM